MWILLVFILPCGDCPRFTHYPKFLASIQCQQDLQQLVRRLDTRHAGGAFCRFLHNISNELNSLVFPLPIGWVCLDKICKLQLWYLLHYLGLYLVKIKIWLDGLVFKIKSIKLPFFLLYQIKNCDIVRRFFLPQYLCSFQFLQGFYWLLVYVSFIFINAITPDYNSDQKMERQKQATGFYFQ